MSGLRLARVLHGLAFLPPIAMGILAWVWFLPLPRLDYWDCVLGTVDTWDHGFARFLAFLWEPFVDQRMVGPKLVQLAIAQAPFESRFWIEIGFGWCMQVVSLVVLARWIGRLRGLSSVARAGLVLAASAWLFAPALGIRFQHHWYSTQYSLAVVPLLVATEALSSVRRPWLALAIAAPLAALAATSHGTGCLGLPALCLVALARRAFSAAQRVMFVATMGAIFAGIVLSLPARQGLGMPELGAAWRDPAHFLDYFLRCLGGLVASLGIGIAVVVALGAGSIWLLRRRGLPAPRSTCWIALAFWGLCVAGATAIHRASLGERPGPLYFAFFSYVQIAAIVVTALVIGRRWRSAGCLLTLLCVWLQVRGFADGMRRMRDQSAVVAVVHELLDMPRVLGDDQLLSVFPRRGFLDQRERLRELGLVPARFDSVRAPRLEPADCVVSQPEASRGFVSNISLGDRARALRIGLATKAPCMVTATLLLAGQPVRVHRIECDGLGTVTFALWGAAMLNAEVGIQSQPKTKGAAAAVSILGVEAIFP